MKRCMPVLLAFLLLMPCLSCAQELSVRFFDVGKADSMLITTPQGTRILIDAGTNKKGKALAERFAKEGIDRIDVMLITHYDKDHVGGADRILENIRVNTVVMPVYDKESKQYEQFIEALNASEAEAKPIAIGEELRFETQDGVRLHITAAHRSSYGKDEENDFSLCLRLDYGETKFLFPGDAEDARQRELIAEGELACDVLKVPYHGRLEDASAAFVAAAAPSIAFVTDSEEEPGSELLYQMLREIGAQVYSARSGDLTVVSDGKSVWVE